ncbi:MAG: ferredoxin [Planctomycetes bacterium]|nr:ferredoxin [Planctomycetota bacterium]
MKVSVNQELCQGAGICESICPEVFELIDDEIAQVKMEIIPEKYEVACRRAVDSCPAQAIRIEE